MDQEFEIESCCRCSAQEALCVTLNEDAEIALCVECLRDLSGIAARGMRKARERSAKVRRR